MTQDEIIEQEIKAYLDGAYIKYSDAKSQIKAFAKLIAAKERERLALKVEDLLTEPEDDWDGGFWNQAIERAVLEIKKGEA